MFVALILQAYCLARLCDRLVRALLDPFPEGKSRSNLQKCSEITYGALRAYEYGIEPQ